MKKLVCDKCGRELTDPAAIEIVLAGTDSWQSSVRSRGEEPRGIFPCEHFRICGGEMIIVEVEDRSKVVSTLKKFLNRLA